MKKIHRIPLLFLCFIITVLSLGVTAQAKDLDEILDYEITVDVRPDAKLTITYTITWKVLDSTSEGPLSWVKIGIPNSHVEDMKALTGNISRIKYLSDDGSYARIDFDRKYKKDEVITFSFSLVQDYMYQVDKLKEGETVYEFTPGWFDDIRVDQMVLRWNNEKVQAFTPSATIKDGYLVWESPLTKGQKYSISVTYKNDAYGFDLSKEIQKGEEEKFPWGIVIFFGVFAAVIAFIVWAIEDSLYTDTANFSTKSKVVRTKVVYYENCPNCGSPRTGSSENCSYCGSSFIKSEEKITEKDIPAQESALKSKKTAGLYPYSSSPNTYIRVHVTHVPIISHSHSSSSSRSSRSHCAHSSCACACACACAGGGRAGCTTKDFYNTNLKLKQLEYKKKRR